MIRLEVQQHGDLERELVHVLELERRQLADDPCVVGRLDRAQRPADVPGDDDLAAGGAEDLAEQLGRRRLSLRAGDADERTRREQAPAELDLRPDGDAASPRLDDERPLARHARVLHDELDTVEQTQVVFVAELGVDSHDLVATRLERGGGGDARPRQPVDEHLHARKFR